jgi:hemoglobin-like flavoprotein
MQGQQRVLLATLVALRDTLRDLDAIVPDLEELGARHVGYCAVAAHYPVIGTVLLEAMAEVGGADRRPEYTAEWARAYEVVAEVMLAGARRAKQVLAKNR